MFPTGTGADTRRISETKIASGVGAAAFRPIASQARSARSMDDRDLFRQAAGTGWPGAFGEVVRRYQAMVYSVCARVLGHSHDADDAAQAVFLILWKKAAGLPADVKLAGWLYRTAEYTARKAATALERQRRRERKAVIMNPPSGGVGECVWEDVRPHLDNALAALSPPQRDAIVLRYLCGHSLDEVARETGCPSETVRTRLRRALEALRRRLAGTGLTASCGSLAIWLETQAAEPVPPGFAEAVQAACAGGAGVSAAVSILADATMKSMAMAPVKQTAIWVALVMVAGGAGWMAHRTMSRIDSPATTRSIDPARGDAASRFGAPAQSAAAVRDLFPDRAAATTYARYALTLEGADGDASYEMVLITEDGAIARGLVVAGSGGGDDHTKVAARDDFTKLAIGRSRIAGEVRRIRAQTETFSIEAAIDGRTISGAYRGRAGRRLKEVQGAISGTYETEADLAARFAVAPGVAWNVWSGPYANFHANPSGRALVDDPRQARLVWQSEYTPPGRSQDRRYGYTPDRRPTGGTCSPIVADGLVTLCYFAPSGPVVDEEALELIRQDAKAKGADPAQAVEQVRDQWRIAADDVVVAIDAATGKTLWRRVFPDAGINWSVTKTRQFNRTPCAFGGRVYAMGSAARLFCLDGRTGTLIWQVGIEPKRKHFDEGKTKALQAESFMKIGRPRAVAGLTCAGGVIAAPDWNGGLIGFDGGTGKELWRAPGSLGMYATPTRWAHGAREFLIAANGAGRIACIEPRSGRMVWQIIEAGANEGTIVAGEGYLVARTRGGKPDFAGPESHADGEEADAGGLGPGGPLACYELNPAGARKIWELPVDTYRWAISPPAIAGGHVVAWLRGKDAAVNGAIVCVELRTGRITSEIPYYSGQGDATLAWADGRLLVTRDGSHNTTEIAMFDASPDGLRLLGEWNTPHPQTTAHVPTNTHPVVDGRLIIRGANGIYCYDLRKP
jgi:RNA polymerase sigma factor (sigma-70 family)